MKKRLFLMIAFLMSLTVIDAESVKTIRLSFNKQQFSFATDETGALEVSSGALLASYGSDTSLPGLPLVAVNVGVPNGVGFGGVSHDMTRQYSSDKTVAVSTNLNENSRNAKVVVASAMGGTCAEYAVSAESPTVIADLSNFVDGVQTITLFVDGENVDSKNILKK